MRRIRSLLILFFATSITSCTSSIEDRVEDMPMIPLVYDEKVPINVKSVSLWMEQVTKNESNQGADCFTDYVCQFLVNHSSLVIMDMKEKKHVATISMTSLSGAYHCNNADFGDSYFSSEDEFPLLYSSHQGRDARCILVDRITHDEERYRLQTVQRITIPSEFEAPLSYTPDAVIDKENDCIYVYTGNTIPISDFYIYKFRLPSITEGDVNLSREDLLASWVIINNPSYYKQGGTVSNDILYIMEGVPAWQADNVLRVIDLRSGLYKTINLSKDFSLSWEPEDVFFYDGKLFIASNQAGFYLVEIE